MKLLITSIGTTGHLFPMMPYAVAACAAGQEVTFATPPAATSVIEALGFPAFSVGPDRSASEAVRLAEFSLEGLSVVEQNALFSRYWILGDHLNDRIRDLVDLGSRWQPDLIVRGEIEYGGCVAAERLGIPHAMIKAYAHIDGREATRRHSLVLAERLGALRDKFGLLPDSDLVMPYRYLEIWPFPPSFRAQPYPSPTCRATRPVPFDQSGPERLPAWIDDLPPRDKMPRVYVTFGTTGVAFKSAEVFEPLLVGLRDEVLSVIVTVGRHMDPTRFGSLPSNVHVEQYIPQSLLFTHCDLVVCHGGSGTVLSGLDHGLPMVMIPLGADQPDNARGGTAGGYALALTPQELTPESIRLAVRSVLDDPTYRMNARRVQEEIHAMPGPDQVVGWFERLARERIPCDSWSQDVN